jgi:hypothetical protein
MRFCPAIATELSAFAATESARIHPVDSIQIR